MINEIQHTAVQHDNITTTASRGQGGSRFEPQPKGYGMSQNPQNEWGQATFDSVRPLVIHDGLKPPQTTGRRADLNLMDTQPSLSHRNTSYGKQYVVDN